MNEKKICFVIAVNNEILYSDCEFYIKNLELPLGFEVEILPIRNASSICNAYNMAINASDAKYKVYLHQDVFIINKNFIYDMIKIFQKDKQIGIMGVCGAKNIPLNGIWWESLFKFGRVLESSTGKLKLLKFYEVLDDYEVVSAIDGLIIMTQYDLKWREDIFDGWHFYDISQCLEFKNSGFKVVVPKQTIPWCIHDCGIVNVSDYEKYRNLFLLNYYKFL